LETWGYPYKHIPRRRSDQSAPVLFDKDPQPDETLVSGMGSSPGTETKQPSDGPGDSVGVNDLGIEGQSGGVVDSELNELEDL
jgi:hypothetical protein